MNVKRQNKFLSTTDKSALKSTLSATFLYAFLVAGSAIAYDESSGDNDKNTYATKQSAVSENKATEGENDYRNHEVTTDTPDEVLLKNMNVDDMFDVKTPSEIVEIDIEGVAHSIGVERYGEKTVLLVPKASATKINLIKKVYVAMSNISDEQTIEIKVI